MKRVSWIFAVAMLGFLSCEEEEFISQRAHSFVKSLDVTQIDDLGATIEFEILKSGNVAIQEYGVEFAPSANIRRDDATKFVKVALSGSPTSSMISVRLTYDLIKGEKYEVRPYVVSGGSVVYGENLIFDSQGVNTPQVTEVTPVEIFLVSKMIIKGDFFNSEVKNNSVEILGLEDQYRVTVDSASHQRLVVTAESKSSGVTPTNEKFDLKVTSGGKSTILPKLISVTVPKIVSVSPISLYVGDRMTVEMSRPLTESNTNFYLGVDLTASMPIGLAPLGSPETLVGNVPSLHPGKYRFMMESSLFSDRYAEEVEVLQSWQSYQAGIQFPTLTSEWSTIAIGDHLLVSNGIDGSTKFSSYDLDATGLRSLSPLPFSSRSGILSLGVAGRYYYYGLGSRFEGNTSTYFKEFYRYDILTDKWERLADYPFGNSSTSTSFLLQGKIYAVIYNQLNFSVYDPQTDQWAISAFEVPSGVRNASNVAVIEDNLYFLSSGAPVTVSRYRIGGNVEVFSQFNENSSHQATLTFWDGNLIVMNNGTPSLRVDLATREFKSIQRIYESEFSSFIPWKTSKGLMMAFPIHKNNYTQENRIYRLIQDF